MTPECLQVGLWFLCLFLGPFPSIGLFCLVSMWWFIFYYILFHFVLLLSLKSRFFSNERQKGNRSRWEGSGKELEGIEWGETAIRIYCIRKESSFNKRGRWVTKSWKKVLEPQKLIAKWKTSLERVNVECVFLEKTRLQRLYKSCR